MICDLLGYRAKPGDDWIECDCCGLDKRKGVSVLYVNDPGDWTRLALCDDCIMTARRNRVHVDELHTQLGGTLPMDITPDAIKTHLVGRTIVDVITYGEHPYPFSFDTDIELGLPRAIVVLDNGTVIELGTTGGIGNTGLDIDAELTS